MRLVCKPGKGKADENRNLLKFPLLKEAVPSFCGFWLSHLGLFTPVLALHSWVQSWKPKENVELSNSYFGQRTFLLRPYELAGAAWLIPRQAIPFHRHLSGTSLLSSQKPFLLGTFLYFTEVDASLLIFPQFLYDDCKKATINNP